MMNCPSSPRKYPGTTRCTGSERATSRHTWEDHPDLTEAQEEFFRQSVRKYIQNSDNFGEALMLCLEAAWDDAVNG